MSQAPTTPTIESLGIDKLNVDQRLQLLGAIWESLREEPPASLLTDAQRAELDRRIAEDDSHPDEVVPWEEVQAKLHARLRP